MKTKILTLLVFVLLLGIYSCECGGWKCHRLEYMYSVNFTGFNDSDLTPLILNRYLKNTNFDSLYRTDTIYDMESGSTDIEKTRALRLNESAYDFSFSAPRINTTYKLTKLEFTTGTCTNCNKKYDVQNLNTYVLNGDYKVGEDVEINK